MNIHPKTDEAIKLFHDGQLCFADIERNGFNMDVAYFHKQKRKLQDAIEKLEDDLVNDPIGKAWKRKYPTKFKLGSNEQLKWVIFIYLKYENEDGSKKVDEPTLQQQEDPFFKKLLQWRKHQKTLGTYVNGILNEVSDDGLLHPDFGLNIATTFRSNSSAPNFQNIPIRDPEQGKIVRRGFIPRPGNFIMEVDFSGAEVKVSACNHKDPRMIDYLLDDTKDMHRDLAVQIFMVKLKQMNKMIRFTAKNDFTFAEFYGSYYREVAKSLWKDCVRNQLEVEGVPMRKHLRREGIRGYEAFESHIRDVENDFWGNRFRVYADWKESLYRQYVKTGYIDTLTSFRCGGYIERNQVCNYPIQGPSFHCLLWSVIRVNRFLKKHKFKTKIVGQIHDSIILDVYPPENDDVMAELQNIMVVKLKKTWDWLIVPMEIEIEATPIDGSWHEKKEVRMAS
jgi:DNA polymerase-1